MGIAADLRKLLFNGGQGGCLHVHLRSALRQGDHKVSDIGEKNDLSV